MSTLTFNASSHVSDTGYFQNLSSAARGLLAALFAVRPVQQTVAPRSAARRVADVLSVYRLARSYESTMPNLAQELRVIAGRD